MGRVLLIPYVAIGGHHALKAFRFRRLDQVAVLELIPTELNGTYYNMLGQIARQRARCVLIKRIFKGEERVDGCLCKVSGAEPV